MFEAYINDLRLLRRNASELDPGEFHHVQTIRGPQSTLAALSGWTLWLAGSTADRIALAWPWALIQHGIPAIDPLQIQSNLLLLDQAAQPMREYQALGVLVHVVNRLGWHVHAREASGEPYQ
jgi:hypothetical protein